MRSGLLYVLLIFLLFAFAGCAGVGGFEKGPAEAEVVKEWNLIWEEQFDEFDSDRWQKATHTFPENIVQFNPDNIVFEDGIMKLFLKDEHAEQRDYTGAEYRTVDSFLYGKFVVRMKPVIGSGIISSFFTFRDPIEPWSEIDLEFLGKDTTQIHLNHWNYEGHEHPVTLPLDFNASADFHEYSFEWQPNYIRWSVDGVPIYTVTKDIPKQPQKIMMNIWASQISQWAGEFDGSVLPVYAQYDYVRYYEAK